MASAATAYRRAIYHVMDGGATARSARSAPLVAWTSPKQGLTNFGVRPSDRRAVIQYV